MRSRNRKEPSQLNVVGLSFGQAFMATMGFYAAQFIATIIGFLILGSMLVGVTFLAYWLFAGSLFR